MKGLTRRLSWRPFGENRSFLNNQPFKAAPEPTETLEMICILLVAGHGALLETQIKVRARKEKFQRRLTGSGAKFAPDTFKDSQSPPFGWGASAPERPPPAAAAEP